MTGPETRPSPSANNDNGGSGRTGNGTTDLDLAVSDGGLDDWEYVKTLSASVSHRNNGGGGGGPGPGATAMITVPTNFGNTPACSGDMGDYRRFSSADSTADETTEATRRLSRDTLATEASYLSSSSPRGSFATTDGFGGTDGDLMSMLAAHQLQGGVTLGLGRGHVSRDGIAGGHHPGDPNVLGIRRSAPPNMHGGRGELLVPPRPRRQRNKQTFAMKLWNLLEGASDCGGAVRWMPNGSSFCVVDPDELVKRVLPRHFKEAKYTSFTRKLNRWGFKHFTLPADAGDAPRDMAVYTHPRFRRDDYASVCEMDGGHRSRTRGNSNPDLSSADFAMSMAGGGGGVGLGGLASFHSTGSLSLASAGGGGRAVQLPQDQRPSLGPAVHLPPQHPSLLPGPLPGAHAHRQQSTGQSSIDVAVSAAQEMSLELQLQDTNRMLMQLNDLQSQFAAGMNGGGGGGGPSDEKIDFSSIDAGAMNSAVSAQPSQSSGDAGMGGKKPSRDDPDALAAFMGMRRTSLGYMPYLPTSSRRGSNISSVSDASNLSDNPFADFPDHSCPVTNPVDDMRDARFHRGGLGGSLAGLLPQSAPGGPSPPPVSAPSVPSASIPGETFEVDIMAQVRDEFERAASDAASSVGVPSSSDGVKKEKVAA